MLLLQHRGGIYMDMDFLANTELFYGIAAAELPVLLERLHARQLGFCKDEILCPAGQPIHEIGLVLQGELYIQHEDVWGGRTLLDRVTPGQLYGEVYACIGNEPSLVSVAAAADSRVLLLNPTHLLHQNAQNEAAQEILLRNLIRGIAGKNLNLSRHALYTAHRSIRGRVLAYLSDQALLHKSATFLIPFDRQQLADYLGVDRSALSAELGKLQREGLLTTHREAFRLTPPLMPKG